MHQVSVIKVDQDDPMGYKKPATVGRYKDTTIDQVQTHESLFSGMCCQIVVPKNCSQESSGNLIHSLDSSSGTGGSNTNSKFALQSHGGFRINAM